MFMIFFSSPLGGIIKKYVSATNNILYKILHHLPNSNSQIYNKFMLINLKPSPREIPDIYKYFIIMTDLEFLDGCKGDAVLYVVS